MSDDPLDAFMDVVSTELKTLNKSNTLKKVKKVVGVSTALVYPGTVPLQCDYVGLLKPILIHYLGAQYY